MKTFNEFEKKIIHIMLKLDKENCSCICIKSILTTQNVIIGKPTDFEFDIGATKKLSIYYYKKINIQDKDDKDFIHWLENQLLDFVLLLNYLIDEKYIVKIPKNLHSGFQTRPSYDRNIPLDPKLENLLGQLWDNKFIIRPELKLLAKHNFKELTLYNEHINNLWTRWLAILSIIISIAYNPIYSYLTHKTSNKKKIDNSNTTINNFSKNSIDTTQTPLIVSEEANEFSVYLTGEELRNGNCIENKEE